MTLLEVKKKKKGRGRGASDLLLTEFTKRQNLINCSLTSAFFRHVCVRGPWTVRQVPTRN